MVRPYALLRAGFPYLKTLGEFVRTSMVDDIAMGKEGRIYCLCEGNSGPISITNLDDEDLGALGAPGHGFRLPNYKCPARNGVWPVEDGGFLRPVQVVVDQDELLYISDEATDRVTIYDRFGTYQDKWGARGSGDGQLDHPAGMAFDDDDNMYVVDSLNHRVQKFTKDGRFLSRFGTYGTGDGEFDTPWGIHVDVLGDIYVSDWRNDRVQKFDSEGRFVFKFGESGSRDGELNRPAGVAVDKDGDIYVADWGNNRVHLYDPEGRFVQMFLGDATLSKSTVQRMFTRNGLYRRQRESGSLELEKRFGQPKSVRVDGEGHMFVADYEGHRVQVYKKEAYPLTEEQIVPPLRSPVLTI